MAKVGVTKLVDNMSQVMRKVNTLTNTDVMVGVPDDKSGRKEGAISNAALAYIHDKGAPEAHIPARPFMQPGIKAAQGQITKELQNAGQAVFSGKNVQVSLNRVGLIASRSIKNVITEGIPPPLAPRTVAGRIARVKSQKRRTKILSDIASGLATSRLAGAAGAFTPLVVTGQLRNAITWMLKKRTKK
jgi:hypothetical protein